MYNRGEVSKLAHALKVPQARVSEAIIIVKHAPDLVDQAKARLGF